MTALAFLALALVISLVGFAVLYFRSRQPTSLESGIDAFKREMHALSPDEPPTGRGQANGHGTAQGPTRPRRQG